MSARLPRQQCAATVLGGPTAVIDIGGLRIVSDPTFDEPGPHGYLTKTAGPVVDEAGVGAADIVLVSHDAHPDTVPAVHGPEDGERDTDGNVNCEVIGFVLSGQGLPTVYISGDNASIRTVTEISRRAPAIDAAILHAGAARVPAKFDGRPLSMDSVRTAAAAAVLGAGIVIPAHYDGWTHFSERLPQIELAFHEAGLSSMLKLGNHGSWIRLTH